GHRTRWIRQGNGWVAGLTAAGERERTAFEQAGRLFNLQPGDDVGQMLPLQPLGQGQIEAVRSALAKLAPGGETPLYRAIQEVLQQDIQTVNAQTPARIVVITDGVNDQTEVTSTTANQLKKLFVEVNERRTEPVKLEVIGFALRAEKRSEQAKFKELQDLIRSVNGRFIDAGDRDRLLKGLRDVLRLAQWQARGTNGDIRQADLGVPIEFPTPSEGRGDGYQIRVDAALGSAESRVELRGGERLELYLTGRGSRLEHRRYDGGSEQRIRDSQTDLQDPSDASRRWFVAAHLPQKKVERAVFPISLQNADPAAFTPRPFDVWIEIQPLGVTADRFVLQDSLYEEGRPVPVLDAVVPGWPSGAEEAEIFAWFTTRPTPPVVALSVADLPIARDHRIDLPGNLPVELITHFNVPRKPASWCPSDPKPPASFGHSSWEVVGRTSFFSMTWMPNGIWRSLIGNQCSDRLSALNRRTEDGSPCECGCRLNETDSKRSGITKPSNSKLC
ncbi:MAG: VWA domain-containing protein, partial [Planctomycetia bacterium]|nr:VWA domain-containing protein [Planctomycetia bacterium]